ncbi:MAG: glycine oxidase ThiO [Actinomycetota bacterium]
MPLRTFRPAGTTMSAPDVVIVGGGVIGLSIAWRAAASGLRVTLVDPNPGHGASWAAAGMLAPVTEVHPGEERLVPLNLASTERYPSFIAELEDATGMDAGYRASGTVVVARDADENEVLADLYGLQRDLGLRSERLGARECRALVPGLGRLVRGGILVAGDHAVDNRALVAALLEMCRHMEVELVATSVVEISTSDHGATGVVAADGTRLPSGEVVVCAGCWSGDIAGIPPDAVPVRPVKGQLLHLRASDPSLLTRTVRGLDVYIVPRGDGRLVVGATVEEQGFDVTATAEAVYTLLRDAYELVPAILEAELVEVAVGLRPGSPDNAPLLGPTALPGLSLATGHYRNGILLVPATADALARLLISGEVPDIIAPFSPSRFISPERIAG